MLEILITEYLHKLNVSLSVSLELLDFFCLLIKKNNNLGLVFVIQMSIGRKWKEILDVTDKISYSFHVSFIWVIKFLMS